MKTLITIAIVALSLSSAVSADNYVRPTKCAIMEKVAYKGMMIQADVWKSKYRNTDKTKKQNTMVLLAGGKTKEDIRKIANTYRKRVLEHPCNK